MPKKAKSAFGKGTEVVIKNTESEYHLETGKIASTVDKSGMYTVDFGATTASIHADDIQVLEQEPIVIDFTEIIGKYHRLLMISDLPTINAASLDGDIHLNYGYDEKVSKDVTDPIKRKGRSPIHQDLRKAFYALGAHLAVACEELDHTQIKDIAVYHGVPIYDNEGDGERIYIDEVDKLLAKYDVSAIRIEGGTSDKAGVVLLGTKRLSTGETVKLESPRKQWESDYPFLHDLRHATDTLIEEVQLYKLGKQAPVVQQAELFGEEEEMLEAEEVN